MTRIVYCSVVVFPKGQIENVWQIKFETGSIDSSSLHSLLQQICSQKQDYMKKTVAVGSYCFYFVHLNHQQRTFLCAVDAATNKDNAMISNLWDFLSFLEQHYLHIKSNDFLKQKMDSWNEQLATMDTHVSTERSLPTNRVDSFLSQNNPLPKPTWKSSPRSMME